MTRNLPTSAARIGDDIDALAALTDPAMPYTRRAFTPRFADGRAWLAKRFAEAGLETRIDAAGNLIGRRAGKTGGATLMLGSHSDTVPNGGRFDGIAGVVAALEVARALAELGVELRHDLEIVDFLAEEVSIFGVSCIGSRGMAGLLPRDWLQRSRDAQTLHEGIVAAGGSPGHMRARDDIAAFLELHIEQGPVLERARQDIGIVTAIVGITRIEIVLDGQADHAGTTPMDGRRDALVAAAALVGEIDREAKARAAGGAHFTATVGEFDIEPNAANVVPSRVRLLIDARAERAGDMEGFVARLGALATSLAQAYKVEIAAPRVISSNPATPCSAALIEVLADAAQALDARHRQMVSGAGHDAAWLARIAPSAMIFVPCEGGRSHAPEEMASVDNIALGAAILLQATLTLDGQSPAGQAGPGET